AKGTGAGVGCFLAGEHPHQGRFAAAVWTDERDPVTTLDVQRYVLEDIQGSVPFPNVLEFEHGSSALGASGKGEMDSLALGCHLDRDHFVEHLDPALYLRRFGRLI